MGPVVGTRRHLSTTLKVSSPQLYLLDLELVRETESETLLRLNDGWTRVTKLVLCLGQ